VTEHAADLSSIPVSGSSGPRLARLGAAATGLVASIAAGLALASVFIDRSADSVFAPFGGWQVYLAEAVLVVMVLAGGLAFGAATMRLGRGLRGRTPNLRAVLLTALLPGLLIGGLAATPMRAVVSWTSDHTAAADAARAELAQTQRDFRLAPSLIPTTRPAAPQDLVSRMLAPADLGTGWYAASQPNATVSPVSADASTRGATRAAHAILTEQHWSGTSWALDEFLVQAQLVFPGSDAAAGYVRSVWAKPDVTSTLGTAVERRVGGVIVWERMPTGLVTPAHAAAAFVVDGSVFTVILDVSRLGKGAAEAELARVVKAAVQRATTQT
jgi:hypothetical protein